MTKDKQIIIQNLKQPTRLDKVIRNHFPDWGRQAVQRLISRKNVKVNEKVVWLASWQVNNGDELSITNQPKAKTPPPTSFNPSWLIAEDDDLIVVNKPAGLLSQPTRWSKTSNLLELVTAYFGPVSLFHRLDRDTSGVVIFSKGGPINQYLDTAFKSRAVKKEYIAMVSTPNSLSTQGIINAYIAPHPKRRDMMTTVTKGGKQAITRYQIIAQANGKQHLKLWPETGRTHQLRVHLFHKKAPILGDRLYGNTTKQKEIKRLMLHAHQITLPTLKEYKQFTTKTYTARLPACFSLKTITN